MRSGVKSLIGAIALGAIAASPASAQNWSGLYFGAHGGYAWTDAATTFQSPGVLGPNGFDIATAAVGYTHSLDGGFGGGQVGLQQQFGQFLLGVEASVSGGRLKGTSLGPVDDVYETKVGWLSTITAKLGYVLPGWLLYAKVGFAGADIGSTYTDIGPPIVGAAHDSHFHTGWTAGLGAEFKLRDNWSLGLEYNYIDLQSKSHGWLNGTATPFALTVNPDPIQSVMVRLNFLLSRDEPRAAPLK